MEFKLRKRRCTLPLSTKSGAVSCTLAHIENEFSSKLVTISYLCICAVLLLQAVADYPPRVVVVT